LVSEDSSIYVSTVIYLISDPIIGATLYTILDCEVYQVVVGWQ